MIFKKINYFTFFIIFSGFVFSCLVANNYIKKYDIIKNINGKYLNTYFFQKEGGVPTFWEEAYKIKNEISEKNFFSTGNKYETKYLPSRLIFLYYSFINKNIKTNYKNSDQVIFKTNNGKKGLILIQNFLYFTCLIFLFLTLKKYVSSFNSVILFFVFFFLSFEPTLNQWNRVLYSETIFFCLQIILLIILISYKRNSNYIKVFFLGIILGLMYLQRTVSIYYFFIIFLYFFIFYKKKSIINISIILFIYLITHLYLGYGNYKRDGKFYLYPILAKEDLYGYFIPKILNHHNDKNFVENFQTRHDRVNELIKIKNLSSENEIEINDRILLANKNFVDSLKLIYQYPFSSIKEYLKSSIHFFLLKPNELYFLFENNITYDGKFYLSKKFEYQTYINVIYSIFVYSICILGFLYLKRKKEFKIIFLLISSILYFSLPVFWHKQSSYLAPILLYLSIFFGVGANQILKKLNFKKDAQRYN